MEIANLGDTVIARNTGETGWKWSKDVKPIVNTNSCQMTHTGYTISGRCELGWMTGVKKNLFQVTHNVPPGHDVWVVGNEPFVAIEITGGKEYATALQVMSSI